MSGQIGEGAKLNHSEGETLPHDPETTQNHHTPDDANMKVARRQSISEAAACGALLLKLRVFATALARAFSLLLGSHSFAVVLLIFVKVFVVLGFELEQRFDTVPLKRRSVARGSVLR